MTEQYCIYCKKSKDSEYFYQVIKRRTYGICCDDDGYEYFRKPTSMCLDCRTINRKRVDKHKEKKRKLN